MKTERDSFRREPTVHGFVRTSVPLWEEWCRQRNRCRMIQQHERGKIQSRDPHVGVSPETTTVVGKNSVVGSQLTLFYLRTLVTF